MTVSRARRQQVPPPLPTREFPQERARVTYQTLLASAGRLFAERGYDATHVPEITAAAGVSVGAFYRYFADKRAVMVELIHIVLERNRAAQEAWLERWRRLLLEGRADGRAFLEQTVRFAAQQQALPAHVLQTFVALSYQDEEIGALRRAYDESDRRALARFLADVTPRERVPSPLAAARLLDLTLEEVLRWASMEGGRPARDVREALVEMLHRYLFA